MNNKIAKIIIIIHSLIVTFIALIEFSAKDSETYGFAWLGMAIVDFPIMFILKLLLDLGDSYLAIVCIWLFYLIIGGIWWYIISKGFMYVSKLLLSKFISKENEK